MTEKTGSRNRGRPATGWTQIGVKVGAPLLARIDAWRAAQSDMPNRPEAIRRLIDEAMSLCSTPPAITAPAQRPLTDGDRVQSDNFGKGTVLGPLRPASSSPIFAGVGPVKSRWIASVQWDSGGWGVTEIAAETLERL
jgi:hypothetical protein